MPGQPLGADVRQGAAEQVEGPLQGLQRLLGVGQPVRYARPPAAGRAGLPAAELALRGEQAGVQVGQVPPGPHQDAGAAAQRTPGHPGGAGGAAVRAVRGDELAQRLFEHRGHSASRVSPTPTSRSS